MYLKKSTSSITGRTRLSIVHGFRDDQGKTRQKTIQGLGYLDELQKKYPDPIAHYEEVAKKMETDRLQEASGRQVTLTFDMGEKLSLGTDLSKNFGYVALSYFYHQLEIDYFLNNRRRYTKAHYNHNAIFKLLVFSRILNPASKKKTYEEKHKYFDKMDFSLADVYRSLSFFAQHKEALLLSLHKRISKLYGRDTSLVYYDVTNYYFEIDKQDDTRRKGMSKENSTNPIMQMGLFMDTNGIPIHYELFPGNTHDSQTFIPMARHIHHTYHLGRIIFVADRGVTSGDVIRQIKINQNGYILSYSIRKADKAFKEYVLDQKGYTTDKKGFKIKSRLYPRNIRVSKLNGQKEDYRVDERQVVYYSEKYAQKAKKEREAALLKAGELMASPAAYRKATTKKGPAKYIKTQGKGEKEELIFDIEKIKEEEQYDGYYAIVTSEDKLTAEQIVNLYRGLWKIEETFKITKSDLETRPVYVSQEDHIEAHFLTCFIALVIVRLLEKELGGTYSVATIAESLNKATAVCLKENIYTFPYYDSVLKDIGLVTHIDFSKGNRFKKDIMRVLGAVKKVDI